MSLEDRVGSYLPGSIPRPPLSNLGVSNQGCNIYYKKNSVFGRKRIKKNVADVTATPFMLDIFTTLKQEAIVASRIVKSKTA